MYKSLYTELLDQANQVLHYLSKNILDKYGNRKLYENL